MGMFLDCRREAIVSGFEDEAMCFRRSSVSRVFLLYAPKSAGRDRLEVTGTGEMVKVGVEEPGDGVEGGCKMETQGRLYQGEDVGIY